MTASDPRVREIGSIDDNVAAVPVTVGTDCGAVTIGCGAIRWRLSAQQADELAALLITALWQAERDAAHGGDQCRDALFAQARTEGPQ